MTKIRFETESCDRCDGSGKFSYNPLDGNRCYGCSGRGTRLTRRGATARTRFDELVAARVCVPADELAPGDRVLSPAKGPAPELHQYKIAWRTITDVHVTGTGDRTLITVTFSQKSEQWTHECRRWSYSPRKDKARKLTDTYSQDLEKVMREIARRYKGAWIEGEEEPPAPIERKPRAPKAPRQRPAVPATPAQRRFIDSLAAKLPAGHELRAEAAGEITKADASPLIDRLKEAVDEARRSSAG